jgi:pimeloyl-ACP methyl ester carboxylesterase
MITLNFVSGLGADERVFQYLDLIPLEKNHIKWIEPFQNESIENYALRLSEQIDKSKINILIGISFGGLISIELAKILKFKKVIIISSVKNKFEIPFYYKIAGKLKLHELVPVRILKSYNRIISYLFGISNLKEEKLLKSILKDTNSIFLKWAISKISNWNNTFLVNELYHIHGSNDRLFPIRYIKNFTKRIDGGHHFMIVTKSQEISKILNEMISDEKNKSFI